MSCTNDCTVLRNVTCGIDAVVWVFYFGRLKHGQAILMLKNNLCAGENAKTVFTNSYDVGVAHTEV